MKILSRLTLTGIFLATLVAFQNCSSGFRAGSGLASNSSAATAPPGGTPAAVTGSPGDPAAVVSSATEAKERGFATSALLVNFDNPTKLNAILDDLVALNAKWVRMDFEWQEFNGGSLTEYNTLRHDVVVKAARAKGLKILAIIDYSNPLANGNQDQMHPPNLQLFANYCRFLVSRYGPMGVNHWEIWNEENTQNYWQPGADSIYFARLLRLAYPAIKAADPAAFVIVGGFAPSGDDGVNQTPQTFLKGLYAAGAKPFFDAIAHHPYTYTGDEYWFTTGVPELRKIMLDNGDGDKRIWLTESGSPSSGNNVNYTEAWQARIVKRILALHLTLDYLGPIFVYDYMDEGTNLQDNESNFGLVHLDMSPKPAYQEFKNAL